MCVTLNLLKLNCHVKIFVMSPISIGKWPFERSQTQSLIILYIPRQHARKQNIRCVSKTFLKDFLCPDFGFFVVWVLIVGLHYKTQISYMQYR